MKKGRVDIENNILEKFHLNGQTLLLGDSLSILANLKEKFDSCITDPPFNISGYDHKKEIGWLKTNKLWTETKKFTKIDEEWDKFSNCEYERFTEKWLRLACDLVKENGNIIVFGTYHNIYKIGYFLEKLNKKIVNSIIWFKRNAFPNITHRMLCESTEHIVWAVNNNPKDARNWTFNYHELKQLNRGLQMRNVWDIPMTPNNERKLGKHPSQKPLKLLERIVLGFTKEGDYILDPFMGSGTLPVICTTLRRKSFNIENNKDYFLLGKKRLQQLDKVKCPTLFDPVSC